MRTAVLVIFAAVGSQGCAELGYSNRVLHRVRSPADSTLIAACQEVPAFDGPGYDIRLERPDTTVVRRLYGSGDGDPCHEMAWSADGRTLAVLSSQAPGVVEYEICAHQYGKGIDWRVCTAAAETRRLRLPGHAAASGISAPSPASAP